ncbi:MAG: putative toxin-antitoxin system toxin component, PIN family [Chloroflexi bacterium]|nr:putative toxin-antitoxin system toxin component, PIN family [Chloroflexota bacterium]
MIRVCWCPLWHFLHAVYPGLPLSSESTFAELDRALRYPRLNLSGYRIVALLNYYSRSCETIAVSEAPAIPDCRDPKGHKFLASALVARADALVTGDGDLLTVADEFAVPIITPAALRSWLQDGR